MSELPSLILASARDLYLEKGLRGFSMRHLAGKLDVSPTALYRHYRNKEELIHKVIEEAVKVFSTYLFTSLAGRTPEDRFRLGSEAYLDFALEQKKYYEVIFMAPEQIGIGPAPECVQNEDLATYRLLIDRVQELMDTGVLAKDDPKDIAVNIWAHRHGLISLYLAGKLPMDESEFRRIYRDSDDRLLRGLRAP